VLFQLDLIISTKYKKNISVDEFKKEILRDYKLAYISRECSIIGRKEVLRGKASFGIFGDGKELPQLAMAKYFKKGDFRSGYYRDQTFMFSINEVTPKQFFAGLYAHTDIDHDPMSAGRQMGSSFATHSLDANYNWKNLVNQYNSSADLSPTASQMPRLLGLAQASRIYKNVDIPGAEKFSNKGSEIAWGTIGDAATSEGLFFETVNAAGVMEIPVILSIWDDNYGISVSSKYQTTKGNISEVLKGFKRDNKSNGFEIFSVKGWDYVELMKTYEKAEKICRKSSIPVIIHVKELTQPLGHSTSGSHERYKSEKRLTWENKYDCLSKFREWILANKIVNEIEINQLEIDAKNEVKTASDEAKFESVKKTIQNVKSLESVLEDIKNNEVNSKINDLKKLKFPYKKDLFKTAYQIKRELLKYDFESYKKIDSWIKNLRKNYQIDYSSHLYSESEMNPVNVNYIEPKYESEQQQQVVDGRIILRDNFDQILTKHKNVLIFGQDSGKIGGVNQGLEGLQKKYGEIRVFDTGIREATIIGQGIGLALRGLRPIAEIQYLDYLLYSLQIISDDLATLHYRTRGKQKCPLIIRTRGHRLEGMWHAGSPMGGIINLIRGVYLLVPRNMTKAAGFYNTLLSGDQPAIVIECLNGYRTKEKLPTNLGEFNTPIGKTETLMFGDDITVVSYGSTLILIEEACNELKQHGITCEVIDCQSLIPFDITNDIKKSIKKTNRLLIIDEDYSGSASAYILDKLINEQEIFEYLDNKPYCLTAKNHRTAYGTDGDYFSKPSIDDIFDFIYKIMNDTNPTSFPL
jgi:pyruvate/2-oxoglutarate/acetoin dehydrogenase E1 component/TPP-dependent pyruvate/acetoin dehydrogenase alpha subunit